MEQGENSLSLILQGKLSDEEIKLRLQKVPFKDHDRRFEIVAQQFINEHESMQDNDIEADYLHLKTVLKCVCDEEIFDTLRALGSVPGRLYVAIKLLLHKKGKIQLISRKRKIYENGHTNEYLSCKRQFGNELKSSATVYPEEIVENDNTFNDTLKFEPQNTSLDDELSPNQFFETENEYLPTYVGLDEPQDSMKNSECFQITQKEPKKEVTMDMLQNCLSGFIIEKQNHNNNKNNYVQSKTVSQVNEPISSNTNHHPLNLFASSSQHSSAISPTKITLARVKDGTFMIKQPGGSEQHALKQEYTGVNDETAFFKGLDQLKIKVEIEVKKENEGDQIRTQSINQVPSTLIKEDDQSFGSHIRTRPISELLTPHKKNKDDSAPNYNILDSLATAPPRKNYTNILDSLVTAKPKKPANDNFFASYDSFNNGIAKKRKNDIPATIVRPPVTVDDSVIILDDSIKEEVLEDDQETRESITGIKRYSCQYVGCNSKVWQIRISFFHFPVKDQKRLQRWLLNCGNLKLLDGTTQRKEDNFARFLSLATAMLDDPVEDGSNKKIDAHANGGPSVRTQENITSQFNPNLPSTSAEPSNIAAPAQIAPTPQIAHTPQIDEKLFYKVLELFPNACPDYIRRLCDGKTWSEVAFDQIITSLFSMDDYPQRTEKPPSSDVEMKTEDQMGMLEAMLPECDPTYLRLMLDKYANDQVGLQNFLDDAISKKIEYPSKKEYLKKQQISAQQKQYTTDFRVEKFIEIFPEPVQTFEDPNRKPPALGEFDLFYLKFFLRNRYRRLSARVIDACLKVHRLDGLLSMIKYLDDEMARGNMIKSARYIVPNNETIQNIPLLQEIAYHEHKDEILKYIETKRKQEEEARENARQMGLLQECQCCYDSEVMPNDIFECQKGCRFCKDCVKKSSEVILGDSKVDFPCLAACGAEFTMLTLQNALPPKMFSILGQKKAAADIAAAGIEDLEKCPFCDFASIPAPGDKLFRCLNPDCMKESCRECKEPSHVPLRCDEVEKDEDVKVRTEIENKMTEALVRECWKCHKKFIKVEGCNKMTCSCGAVMCYVCRQPVENYKHFNGQGGSRTDLCPLYSDNFSVNEKEVMKAAKEAKKNVATTNLKFDPTADLDSHFGKGKKAHEEYLENQRRIQREHQRLLRRQQVMRFQRQQEILDRVERQMQDILDFDHHTLNQAQLNQQPPRPQPAQQHLPHIPPPQPQLLYPPPPLEPRLLYPTPPRHNDFVQQVQQLAAAQHRAHQRNAGNAARTPRRR